jgi:transposase
MGKKTRNYDEAFKRQAVKRLTHERIPVTQLARELGVAVPTLYDWKQRFGSLEIVSPQTKMTEQDELKKLRRENAELREDNTILKKYAAYITKESR